MHSSFVKSVLAATVFLLPALGACSSPGREEVAYTPPEFFSAPVDPDDTRLHTAVQDYLARIAGPRHSQYQYSRVDLNGDGLREGLVLFTLPHSYWCGWSGCTMAVFEAGDNRFSLRSETAEIRGPIVISQTSTHGWHDIGVRMTGTVLRDYNVLLQYDGTRYPANPAQQAPLPYDLAALGGARVFP